MSLFFSKDDQYLFLKILKDDYIIFSLKYDSEYEVLTNE